MSARRALPLLAFAGNLITIAGIGAITASLGRMVGVGPWQRGGRAFFVVVHLMDVIPLSIPAVGPGKMRQRGILAAYCGLVSGIALGPCTFATWRLCSGDVQGGATQHRSTGPAARRLWGATAPSWPSARPPAVQRHIVAALRGTAILRRSVTPSCCWAGTCFIPRGRGRAGVSPCPSPRLYGCGTSRSQ